MARDRLRNVAASVRQRLLNHSIVIKADPNLVLTWYGLERLLYRLSLSVHRDRFVLKGAMLFRLWGGTDFRSTKDLDLLGFLRDEAEVVRDAFVSICEQVAEDDGMVFDASSVRVAEIRDGQAYGGFRVLLTAKLGTAVLPLQIDVGFGDAVTPAPIYADFPSLLDQPRPHIRIYPRETVVAEKFEAMVQLGMTNSRMKDYYDLWFMSRRFDFDGPLLAAAIRATFERRATTLSETVPVGLTSVYADDSSHVRQWTAFSRRVGGDKPPALMDVIEAVGEFVLPPARAAIESRAFPRRWTPQAAWH
jgi:predicted nucleotidyltransferase component of viral defense system